MTYTDFEADSRLNPLDLVERMAALNEWSFERSAEDEITISLEGRWTDCHVSFQWMELHIACAFDLKVPEKRKTEVLRLLSLINEQMWIGHFDLWSKEGVIMFRHALLLAGAEATDRQLEVLMECAIESVERYFPAFQFVVWAGKSAREAMDATLFETVGEA